MKAFQIYCTSGESLGKNSYNGSVMNAKMIDGGLYLLCCCQN